MEAAMNMGTEVITKTKGTILIVEDQILSTVPLVSIAKLNGFETDIAVNGAEACHMLKNHRYDLLILDWFMPYKNGSETMKTAGKIIDYSLPFILYTGVKPEAIDLPHIEALQLVDYWEKPISWGGILKRFDSLSNRIK